MSYSIEIQVAEMKGAAAQIDGAGDQAAALKSQYEDDISPYISRRVWGDDHYGDRIWGGATGLGAAVQNHATYMSGVHETLSGPNGIAKGVRDAAQLHQVTDEISSAITALSTPEA